MLIDKLSIDLKLILNSISHAILFESADHHIQFVNDSFCSLFHIPVASDLLVGADCSKAAEQSSALFRTPTEFINRIYLIYKEQLPVFNEEIAFADGTYIYRDYKPIFENGVIRGHLWTYKNIVEIKHIVEEVKKQKDFYENLLNNIPADIAIFDKDHRYLFTNKSPLPMKRPITGSLERMILIITNIWVSLQIWPFQDEILLKKQC